MPAFRIRQRASIKLFPGISLEGFLSVVKRKKEAQLYQNEIRHIFTAFDVHSQLYGPGEKSVVSYESSYLFDRGLTRREKENLKPGLSSDSLEDF
ncbi:hypothetical protein STEG23_022724 [Scotinomys teguina]